MKYKDELLDETVDEYTKTIECYLADINKLMSNYSFNHDDMRKMADVAYEMAQYAEETADVFERIAEGGYEE